MVWRSLLQIPIVVERGLSPSLVGRDIGQQRRRVSWRRAAPPLLGLVVVLTDVIVAGHASNSRRELLVVGILRPSGRVILRPARREWRGTVGVLDMRVPHLGSGPLCDLVQIGCVTGQNHNLASSVSIDDGSNVRVGY